MSIFNDPLVRMMQKITEVEKRLNSALSALHSPYPVLNENTPAQITANMNDYAPGDYAALRLSTDASRSISGFTSGKKGRVLKILNVGATNNLVILHDSATSAIANRILSHTAANFTLGPNDSCELYYDSTSLRWRVSAIAL